MFTKLAGVENRYVELEKVLSDPETVRDREAFEKYSREHAELGKIVDTFRAYKQVLKELEESMELMRDSDPEIKNLAKDEMESLNEKKEALEQDVKKLLLPKDSNDDKNVLIEIRAGTCGEEAGLFAGDLFRMYGRYAENKGWKVEIMSQHVTGVGGLKEIIAMIHGKGAFSRFKFESGTHRVQRVPVTETQGRIHTSAVTVAVLPEAEDVEVNVDPNEIKVDVYRATGPGGQSVNTTDSAVRITHLPTGLVVTCQDEKSQLKNKNKAFKVLKARLYDQEMSKRNKEISSQRRSMIRSGDRSEKIRTYNFPQGRVTDHRINLTLYRLEEIMYGDLDSLINEIQITEQAERIKESELSKSNA